MFWDDLLARNSDLAERGLRKPIIGLAPMDGVTDAPFRFMVAKYGGTHTRCVGALHTGCVGDGVDVVFTEFVSVDALHYAKDERRERLLKTLIRARDVGSHSRSVGALHTGCVGDGVDVVFTEFVSVDALHYAKDERRERLLKTLIRARDVGSHSRSVGALHSGSVGDRCWPFEVAQVFGKKPEFFAEAAVLVESLGFDGIDINMGCPAHKVEESGSGAGLIHTPALAQEIIRTVKAATKLPVSVKTRIGVDKDVAEEWMEQLMEVRPAMISLHGRTLKQLYQGRADWEAIARAAKVVHKHGGHILGNGDITSINNLQFTIHKYGVDGVLIGRAAEGNPGVFVGLDEPTKEQRLAWMVEHARVFEKIFKEDANPPSLDELRRGTRQERWFLPVRKHLAWYCKGFPGAGEMRVKLVQANSVAEVEEIVLYFQNILS